VDAGEAVLMGGPVRTPRPCVCVRCGATFAKQARNQLYCGTTCQRLEHAERAKAAQLREKVGAPRAKVKSKRPRNDAEIAARTAEIIGAGRVPEPLIRSGYAMWGDL
jgi:hypothetical protein